MMRIAALAVSLAVPLLAQTGKELFQARCAGCHGEDGAGAGHGPSIINLNQARVTTREGVRDAIRYGIPGTTMPAFTISGEEAVAIADYVIGLRSPGVKSFTPDVQADRAAGERYFFGAGKCSSCHMIHGVGGVLGPDLADIARTRTMAQIELALREPGASTQYRAVTVRLRDGRTLQGVAKNESQFDLQLLGTDGELHLLRKDALSDIRRERSIMPSVDAAAGEMRDLLAYLNAPSKPGNAPAEIGGIPFKSVAEAKPGSWPTYHGNLSGNRFSPLTQINTNNVTRVVPKWIFPLPGASRALETTPVVVEGVMYVTSVNEAWALDARSGREIWHYNRPRSRGLVGDAAGGINRGVAVLGNRVFMVSDNAHLFALHRLTGQLLWDVEMAGSGANYGSTSAPLVVGDLVVAGVSGGDEGVRGFLDAYHASTGERAWRFWTIPAPGEPGSETWSGNSLAHGCGATWLTGTYDPESSLLYWPTGNPCPDYNGAARLGDNLYTSSVLALDPVTGKLRWHFQFTPHDVHDWDATETPVLVDAAFRGQPRKLLLQGNRNGFFYVLDRLTGKLLLASPFVNRITWASGIGADGRPQLLPANEPADEGQLVCPSVAGAANWPSNAYNPATGLFYLFAEESCSVYSRKNQDWQAGRSFYGGSTRNAPTESGGKFLRAIDIQNGKVAWEIPGVGGGILGSGLVATAGGLIFYGDGSGAFVAADGANGKLLWHFNTGQSWKAGPMTYTIDGMQYIGVAAGSTIMAFGLQ